MAAARALEVEEENVVVASTGIIGQTLPVEAIEAHAAEMEMKYDNSLAAAEAIMTTDTKIKTFAVEFEAGGTLCHMGGICKGSGMIHPNMGTMLCFITTDCAISANMMKKALLFYVDKTFNRVTVDGDTSTNDMCVVMANGMAGNKEITEENESYDAYCEALHAVMKDLARENCGRRRRSQQADNLYGNRSGRRGKGRDPCQIDRLFFPDKSGYVWIGCQLGGAFSAPWVIPALRLTRKQFR